MVKTYTEYRLEWTYPYLADQGKTQFTEGARSKDAARTEANKNDGYYWAGRDIGWQTRQVTVTDWEDEDA